MGDIVMFIVSLVQGLFLIALLGVGVLIGLTILSTLVRGLKQKIFTGSGGFIRYHADTVFEKRLALSTRTNVCKTPDCSDLPEGQEPHNPNLPIAVLKFDGDVTASERETLARQITEVIANRTKLAGVIVLVASPGGGVSQYGQLYAEMERLRKAGVHITVCIDTVAASGGYLMSLPANKIVAAPFAMVGSIGVVAMVPNARRLLQSLGIDPRIFFAGKYKRTVTTVGEDSPEAVEHFKAQLESIHRQFIAPVVEYRKLTPEEVEAVCNGDHWTARESMEKGLKLVDELATSEEYLFALNADRDLVFVKTQSDLWSGRLSRFVMNLAERLLSRAWTSLTTTVR